MEQNIQSALINIGQVFVQNTIDTITSKIEVAKTSKDKDKTIEKLEEIIMNLLDERADIRRNLHVIEEEMAMQKISDENIKYIIDNLFPTIIELQKASSTNNEQVEELEKILKPIISKESFTILQLLGFNFKKAIGEPLTELVRSKISEGMIENNYKEKGQIEYSIEAQKTNRVVANLITTEEGYERYKEIFKPNK